MKTSLFVLSFFAGIGVATIVFWMTYRLNNASADMIYCSGPMAPGWNVSLPNGGCAIPQFGQVTKEAQIKALQLRITALLIEEFQIIKDRQSI